MCVRVRVTRRCVWESDCEGVCVRLGQAASERMSNAVSGKVLVKV